jgi:hypothetical protein
MNTNRIIFLGIINSIEEFYELTGKNPVDLELSEEQEIYNDKQIIITEEEIKQYLGEYKDIKELRDKIYNYYKENIQGKIIDIGKYKNIRISRQSAERYKYYGADERKLLIVIKLLEVLKSSKYKNSEMPYKTRKDRIKIFYYFTNKIILRNEVYDVYITIAEDNNGNLFYDLDENKESLKE